MSAVRGARRAAIYTKSVGIPDRWPRQNARFARLVRTDAREREPVVAPFTKKLARGVERSRAASGDEHRHLRHSEIAIFALGAARWILYIPHATIVIRWITNCNCCLNTYSYSSIHRICKTRNIH